LPPFSSSARSSLKTDSAVQYLGHQLTHRPVHIGAVDESDAQETVPNFSAVVGDVPLFVADAASNAGNDARLIVDSASYPTTPLRGSQNLAEHENVLDGEKTVLHDLIPSSSLIVRSNLA